MHLMSSGRQGPAGWTSGMPSTISATKLDPIPLKADFEIGSCMLYHLELDSLLSQGGLDSSALLPQLPRLLGSQATSAVL